MGGGSELGRPDTALARDGRRHLSLRENDDEGCNISWKPRKHEAFCAAMTYWKKNRRLTTEGNVK